MDRLSRFQERDVDTVTWLRRRLCPPIHRLTSPVGGFAQCIMATEEYVGCVEREIDHLATDLLTMGFRREPISALKLHPDGRMSAGSWVKRRSALAEKQLHVTLFRQGADAVEIYAHLEDSWIRHPIRHYRATAWDTATGVRLMRRQLSNHGISFEQ